MSSLALMRWLESTPERYDAGMRWLTLGRVDRLHEALAEAAAPTQGRDVLEIGCGTGSLTRRLVARGARVVALDGDPAMLEQARARVVAPGPGTVRWLERSAAEIDALPEAGFDAVVASLCLSEMSASERGFVLREAARRLRPGGVVAIGDEQVPPSRPWRVLHAVLRAPQAALAWLLVGSLSRPLRDPAAELRAAGLAVQGARSWLGGRLGVVVAERAT